MNLHGIVKANLNTVQNQKSENETTVYGGLIKKAQHASNIPTKQNFK